ncbi:hypothetical protein NDU88_005278 [Pleurodeles waltl]|uniref:Uncharacterized protein n=1 Tax=Pleurodeles waltl TaxID=8319 RepID=A0AAV7LC19_PLEWA|nr:hypothetical protein NDU88_005278 [Pleurodeles waltl]
MRSGGALPQQMVSSGRGDCPPGRPGRRRPVPRLRRHAAAPVRPRAIPSQATGPKQPPPYPGVAALQRRQSGQLSDHSNGAAPDFPNDLGIASDPAAALIRRGPGTPHRGPDTGRSASPVLTLPSRCLRNSPARSGPAKTSPQAPPKRLQGYGLSLAL